MTFAESARNQKYRDELATAGEFIIEKLPTVASEYVETMNRCFKAGLYLAPDGSIQAKMGFISDTMAIEEQLPDLPDDMLLTDCAHCGTHLY